MTLEQLRRKRVERMSEIHFSHVSDVLEMILVRVRANITFRIRLCSCQETILYIRTSGEEIQI